MDVLVRILPYAGQLGFLGAGGPHKGARPARAGLQGHRCTDVRAPPPSILGGGQHANTAKPHVAQREVDWGIPYTRACVTLPLSPTFVAHSTVSVTNKDECRGGHTVTQRGYIWAHAGGVWMQILLLGSMRR